MAAFRKDHGEPDVIEIRQTFPTDTLAREWEFKVLQRMKVRKNERWLNKYDGIASVNTEEMIVASRIRMKENNPAKRDDIRLKMSAKAKIRGADPEWRRAHSEIMKTKPSPNKGKRLSERQKKMNSENKKDTIWITNGEIDKMIKIDKADEFLDNGFVRGRKSWTWKKGENR